MPDYRKALLFSKLEQKKEYSFPTEETFAVDAPSSSIDSVDLYVKEIQQYKMLEKEEERDLLILAQNNDLVAREKIIHANLRLVVRIARRYRRPGIALPDLIAEGNFGLIHAIRKFDLSLDHRFSTYASWWIQHYVEYYLLNQVRVVRLPVHISKKIHKLEKTEKKLLQEVQSQSGAYKQLPNQAGLSREEVSQLKIWADPASNMDPQEDDFSNPLHLDEESTDLSIDVATHKQDFEMSHNLAIQDLLGVLTDLEKDIVFHRTGMGGFSEMTFEEIGSCMDLKKDRVRCIYQRALKKMLKGYQANSDEKELAHDRAQEKAKKLTKAKALRG